MFCKFHLWTSWYRNLLNFVPSGLQIGFFLERAGRDYIIFERENLAGILWKDTNYSKALFYRLQLDKPKFGYLGRCAKIGEEVSVAAVHATQESQRTPTTTNNQYLSQNLEKTFASNVHRRSFVPRSKPLPFFSSVFRAALLTDIRQLGCWKGKGESRINELGINE